jgi:uncharacterized protein with HEPN domain
MSNFFELSEDTFLKKKLEDLLDCMQRILEFKPTIKKLTDHPISEWYEWFSSEVFSDMVNPGHLLLNEKESLELFNDFRRTRNKIFFDYIESYKSVSIELVENYVDESIKEKFRKSNNFKPIELSKEDSQMVKFMRDF